MDRVDKDNYYLNIAEEVSKRSTCLKRHYGAVIVNNGEIISTGYSGAPRKLLSCYDTKKCLRENSKRGTDYSFCTSVHAEQNAIISSARRDMIGSDIYLVGIEECNPGWRYVINPSPCSLCKRMIINAGISRVIIRKDEHNFDIINVSDWDINDIVGGY